MAFYVNGNVLLGTGASAGSDANHDALFTYVTGATQLKVAGGLWPSSRGQSGSSKRGTAEAAS